MYTDYTYQDWLAASDTDRIAMLEKIVRDYKASEDFKSGLTANEYFRTDNTEVRNKMLMQPRAVEYKDNNGRTRKKSQPVKIAGNRVRSGFFPRFVIQQNQFLLSNGVTLDNSDLKKRLGLGFDKQLERCGEKALLHGVCWGFWNYDHLEIIEAVKDGLSGAVALLDEETSEPMVLVQFWQINNNRPLYLRVFSPDGVVKYRMGKEELEEIPDTRRPYVVRTQSDAYGPVEITGENYGGRLPVVPLWASEERRSELTLAIKSKIDLYDRIFSDFGDNLDRANDVYWVLNNFGGTIDDVAEMLEQINRVKAVANLTDGTGTSSTAELKTVDVPYAARQTALDILQKQLYSDFMALDMDALTGGSLTNVAIETATANLNLKADRYEWQVFRFVQGILALIGVETEQIKFKRQTIANRSEIVQDIAVMRQDIDLETALKLNPYIEDQSEIDSIMKNKDAEAHSGAPSMGELEKMLAAANQAAQ